MSKNNETLNRELYNLLDTRGYDPISKDSDVNQAGKTVPPEEADIFKFVFKHEDKEIDTVWVTVDGSKTLKIYYDKDIADTAGSRSNNSPYDDSWYGLLRFLKGWAQSRQLGFELSPKEKLDSDMAQRTYMKKKERISEGYYAMGKSASYNDNIPTIKIILQHTRQMQEGEQRYRNIAKIFLENAQGERILAPTIKPGIAHVYARHLAEGGVPNDERWNHIKSLCEEYNKMAGFVRAVRGNQFNESAQRLVEAGLNHYQKLRESLGKMRGHRGYNAYFESWAPALMETEGDDQTNLNELFVQETLDPRIESVMPILNKLNLSLGEMKEVSELAEWANALTEVSEAETMAYYKATSKKSRLDDFDLNEDEIDDAEAAKKKINIPAFKRKAKGGDWKVTQQDLDKIPAGTRTTSPGLASYAKRIGLDEEGVAEGWEDEFRARQAAEKAAKSAQEKEYRQYGITARKSGGDDAYSWAVFINGHMMVNGLSKREVLYYKKIALEKAKEKQGVTEGLAKDIKRLATGKDVKSRAGQEISKAQQASMTGDNKTAHKHFNRYDKLDKLANKEQGVAEALSWKSLDEGLNLSDKLTIFEEFHINGNLTESIEEDSKSYFTSLFDMSDDPIKNKKYIVVPLSLIGNKILPLDKPSYMTYLGKTTGQLVFSSSKGQVRYPSSVMRDLSIFNTFTFETSDAYNKFKVTLLMKFDVNLPEITLTKKQGVAEGHADQQRKIFKQNGKPVGEVGIDRESSPGVGQWYMKCYAYDIDNSGYDSYEEAVAELKHCLKQGVTEGIVDDMPADSMVGTMDKIRGDAKLQRYHYLQKLLKQSKNPKTIAQIKALLTKELKQGVAEGYSNTTFNVDRRKLNVPALIQKGAIFVTYPHGEQGWETDNKEDWAFSLLSLYNVFQGGWPSEAKKYLKPESYKRAEQQINSSAPNLGSDKLVYDGKYNQILWSIKKLGIPDNVAFLDKGQQGVAEGIDSDTQRLEQDIRDALANGDDYTAKQYAKMASTPEAKKYLQKIIRQEMYGTGPGQGGVAEDLDTDQKSAGQLGPTGRPATVGDLVGANESVTHDPLEELKRLLAN